MKETDPAEKKQSAPPVLSSSGMKRTLPVCHPRSLADEGCRVTVLPALCLHKVGSLDSLVINTLCLNLGLHGNIFVPKGYKSPCGFQLAPSPPSRPSKGIADSDFFSALLRNSSFFFFLLFVLSPSVGAKLVPQLAKF